VASMNRSLRDWNGKHGGGEAMGQGRRARRWDPCRG
jgi:hypothetical protein